MGNVLGAVSCGGVLTGNSPGLRSAEGSEGAVSTQIPFLVNNIGGEGLQTIIVGIYSLRGFGQNHIDLSLSAFAGDNIDVGLLAAVHEEQAIATADRFHFHFNSFGRIIGGTQIVAVHLAGEEQGHIVADVMHAEQVTGAGHRLCLNGRSGVTTLVGVATLVVVTALVGVITLVIVTALIGGAFGGIGAGSGALCRIGAGSGALCRIGAGGGAVGSITGALSSALGAAFSGRRSHRTFGSGNVEQHQQRQNNDYGDLDFAVQELLQQYLPGSYRQQQYRGSKGCETAQTRQQQDTGNDQQDRCSPEENGFNRKILHTINSIFFFGVL